MSKAASAKLKTGRKQTGSAPEAGIPEQERFIQDLLVRGEAAPLSKSGTLPRDATHVVQENDRGQVTVRRARLKAW